MDSSPNLHSDAAALPAPTSALADEQLQVLSTLVDHLDGGSAVTQGREVPVGIEVEHQNQLVQVRLGLAGSLFAALRAKHAPTAAHCLRVALSSSCWSLMLQWDERRRDTLEVAALLHDIGKIGVPDQLLLKPSRLTSEEAAVIARHRAIGEQILLSCCASHEVLDIVKYAPAWYDGSKAGFDRRGEHLPLGARVVSILDAFDAMTTDQVYRRALSHERAVAELSDHAGNQFDPRLVEQFHQFLAADHASLTARVSHRWLRELSGPESNAFWQGRPLAKPPLTDLHTVDMLFHQRLLDSMHDGVIFVDNDLRILLLNRAAERMTGLTAESLLHRRWSPELIGLRDEEGAGIDAGHCPFIHAIATRAPDSRQLMLKGGGGERLNVDAQMVPVIGCDGVMHGATLLLHDASSRVTLEQRVQSLHLQATRDSLTNVANRSEFDRVHFEFVERHHQYGRPCALIICDIDHFKTVNDSYGHQAGDAVLINFAAMLQRSCRTGDLVARYGGEEFVVLCADCDNATVTNRAERIRGELARTPQASLDNRPITASFGVTEIQAGDSPETMLRRADRALMRAKESGRNRVVQLGTGIPQDTRRDRRRDWRRWFRPIPSHHLVEETLMTAVPLAVTMEKLRGFVSDHHAEIVATEDGKMRLQVTKRAVCGRRGTDRPVSFILSLQFLEQRLGSARNRTQSTSRTIIHVTIQLTDNRDRRRDHCLDGARHLFASLKSYFMAQAFDGSRDLEHADTNPALLGRLLAIVARWGHPPVR